MVCKYKYFVFMKQILFYISKKSVRQVFVYLY